MKRRELLFFFLCLHALFALTQTQWSQAECVRFVRVSSFFLARAHIFSRIFSPCFEYLKTRDEENRVNTHHMNFSLWLCKHFGLNSSYIIHRCSVWKYFNQVWNLIRDRILASWRKFLMQNNISLGWHQWRLSSQD